MFLLLLRLWSASHSVSEAENGLNGKQLQKTRTGLTEFAGLWLEDMCIRQSVPPCILAASSPPVVDDVAVGT